MCEAKKISYTAEYEIIEFGFKNGPLTCTVGGYKSILDLKKETAEIVQQLCNAAEIPYGTKVIVRLTITDNNGEYVDSDEDEMVYPVEGATQVYVLVEFYGDIVQSVYPYLRPEDADTHWEKLTGRNISEYEDYTDECHSKDEYRIYHGFLRSRYLEADKK